MIRFRAAAALFALAAAPALAYDAPKHETACAVDIEATPFSETTQQNRFGSAPASQLAAQPP